MDAKADVVIIGAGIVGTSAAWELVQAGVTNVIVIDQGHIVLDGPRDEVLARLRGAAAVPASAPSGPPAQPTSREGKTA